MAARRGRWHPPPAPSPRILHLPRRSRTIRPAKPPPPAARLPAASSPLESRRNLRDLLDQERPLVGNPERRRRGRWLAEAAETSSGGETVGDSGEERWRLQAEILRAECKFLRMERDVALKEVDRSRERITAAFTSGRKKIDGTEDGVEVSVSEDETGVREELQVRRRRCVKDGRRCWSNFDRQASVLRRRLEKIAAAAEEEETSVREVREVAAEATSAPDKENDGEAAAPWSDTRCRRFTDVEMLRRKMEGLSKGLLEKMEEAGFFHSAATASANNHRHHRQRRHQQHHRQASEVDVEEDGSGSVMMRMVGSCCNCKEVVERIAEQVRVETEQWNEMQGMLDQVRVEIEDLHSSRDLWQRRAIASGLNLRSLHTQMLEWRRRALASEHKVTELEEVISHLHIELETSRNPEPRRIKGQQQQQSSLESQREKEKHVLVCRLKKQSNFAKRLPLRDIGNSSVLFKAYN